MSISFQFAVHGSYFVHQAVVTDIGSSEYMLTHLKPLDEVFKPDSDCFMLGHPHYGSIGKVSSFILCSISYVSRAYTILTTVDLIIESFNPWNRIPCSSHFFLRLAAFFTVYWRVPPTFGAIWRGPLISRRFEIISSIHCHQFLVTGASWRGDKSSPMVIWRVFSNPSYIVSWDMCWSSVNVLNATWFLFVLILFYHLTFR